MNWIDLHSPIVCNAIAGIINSAFETGLNPAWFEIDSLNKGGFLDSAFSAGTPIDGKLCGEMETPSGKPARTDWFFKGRLNGYMVSSAEDADSPWAIITPAIAVANWYRYAVDVSKSAYCREQVTDYLRFLDAMGKGDYALAEQIQSDGDWDGVSDDGMAQIAISGDWIFG